MRMASPLTYRPAPFDATRVLSQSTACPCRLAPALLIAQVAVMT